MPSRIVAWRGDAPAVARIVTITITADDAATSYRVTINDKVVSALGTGIGVNATATALRAALAGSTIREFQEAVWTVAGAVITATAAVPGMPFDAASSVSGGSGTIGPVTVVEAGSGPEDLATPKNWSTGDLPGTGVDDVAVITETAGNIKWNLEALYAGNKLTAIYFDSTFTGDGGLPRVNTGTTPYVEYRSRFIKVKADKVIIGQGTGGGSPRLQLDQGDEPTEWNVYRTGQSQTTGTKPLILRGVGGGTGGTNVLNIFKGSVYVDDDADLDELNIGSDEQPASDVNLVLSPSVVLGQVRQFGGVLTIQGACGSLLSQFAAVTLLGEGDIGPVTLLGKASMVYRGTGDCGDVVLGSGSALDFSRAVDPVTVASVTMSKGSKLIDRNQVCSFVTPIVLSGCGLADVTLDLGDSISIQRS